jgi:hypothetical protein
MKVDIFPGTGGSWDSDLLTESPDGAKTCGFC